MSLPSIGLWDSPTSTPQPTTTFDAILVNETIPASMSPGQSYTVSITMRNTGFSSWSNDTPIVLAPSDDPANDAYLFNKTALKINPGVIIKTGSDYTWYITMHAPGWNGNCTVIYQMRSGNDTYFGTSVSQNIVVGNPGSAVAYLAQDVLYYPHIADLSMKANSWQNVSVTVQNLGRDGWSDDDHVYLGAVDYVSNNATLFNPSLLFHIAPQQVIQPCDHCTWRFQLHAPPGTGTYRVEYQMKRGDAWLGQPLVVYVTVT